MFTEEELFALIDGVPVGSSAPYSSGDTAQIDAFLRDVARALDTSPLLKVEGEFSYGSGFASYVHLFCTKSAGRSTVRQGDIDTISGIAVYLSRLASVAAFAAEIRTRHKRCGTQLLPHPEGIGEVPRGDWDQELAEITATVERFGIRWLTRDYLIQPLPHQTDIATVLSEPPYQIFDAIFRWED